MNSLSDTKVSISEDTLNSAGLDRNRKLELRKQAIRRYVASRNGQVIKFDEFASVAHYRSTPGARTLVQQMVESGDLQQEQLGPKQFAYTIATPPRCGADPHQPGVDTGNQDCRSVRGVGREYGQAVRVGLQHRLAPGLRASLERTAA